MYHRTNSPGALDVKAGVKTREHDSRREHCMSRELPGYYFGKRVLRPECSCRWPWSNVFSFFFFFFSCVRSRQPRSPYGGDASLSSAVLNSSAPLLPSYIKTTLSQGPRLEGRRPPRVFKDPLPLSEGILALELGLRNDEGTRKQRRVPSHKQSRGLECKSRCKNS